MLSRCSAFALLSTIGYFFLNACFSYQGSISLIRDFRWVPVFVRGCEPFPLNVYPTTEAPTPYSSSLQSPAIKVCESRRHVANSRYCCPVVPVCRQSWLCWTLATTKSREAWLKCLSRRLLVLCTKTVCVIKRKRQEERGWWHPSATLSGSSLTLTTVTLLFYL